MSPLAGRERILVAAMLGFVAAFAVFARLVVVQVFAHEHYEARAEQHQEGRVLLPPRRGDVFDRRGVLLATDLHTYSIHAVPRLMSDPRATARKLSRLLDLDARRLARRFRERPKFAWVARKVDPTRAERLQQEGLRGVYFSVETRREMPGGVACEELVGRVNLDGRGIEGLEYQYESVLRGRPGWTTAIKDGRGKKLFLPRGEHRDPVHGHGLVLSLDARIQDLVVARLEEAVEELEALKATAVIVEPTTGEVLAMASTGPGMEGVRKQPAITDVYEPGSTFKVVVSSAVIEEGLARPGSIYHAEEGAFDFGGFVIHDVHPYEEITLRDAVRYSSNIVAGKLGVELGDRKFYEYATAFGFGSLTGIDFPGEVAGKLRPPHQWSGRSLPTLSIGQELAATPLQVAMAYAAIANGGLLMKPRLVIGRVDPEGRIVERAEPRAVRRVLSPGTARHMRDFLQAVVDSGTATRAQLDWAAVAGKTGTAQKYDPETGTYSRSKFVSSFAGFVPADDPRLVCLLIVDEPGKGHYGGTVAAPVFRRILEDIRRLPGGALSPRPSIVLVQRDEVRGPPPTVIPDVRLLPLDRAHERLAERGLRGRVSGDGERVLSQSPPAGAPAERGDVVELVLDPEPHPRVPDVVGLTLRRAHARLQAANVAVRFRGSGVVVAQSPPAGSRIRPGQVCTVRCEPATAAVLAGANPGGDRAGR